MTTPDDQPVKIPRITRPDLKRDKPDRTATAAKSGSNGSAKAHSHASEAAIDEAVAHAVRSSYDTLASTIAQGREAADRFRLGRYNMREVPADAEKAIMRMLDLARQLSGTTIDLIEQLVHQMTSMAALPEPGETKVPPFRQHGEAAMDAAPAAAGGTSSTMPILVGFTGSVAKASSSTTSLTRPLSPAAPEELQASSLTSKTDPAKTLGKVTFGFDVSKMRIVATVDIPEDAAKGTYVGFVSASDQDEPLGLLVVRLDD